MYIIKNAIKNIGRNKGRNILLSIIIFVIILITAVSIIINSTTSSIIKDYKQQFGSEVTLQQNYEKMQSSGKMEQLKNDVKLKLSESDLLKDSEKTGNIGVIPKNLKSLDEDKANNSSSGLSAVTVDDNGNPQNDTNENKALIVASSRDDISDDFKKGTRKITEGKMYENPNECLVSEDYAKLNNLSVGDEIDINDTSKKNPVSQKLKISGIYKDDTMTGDNIPPIYKYLQSPATNKHNEILVSFDTFINSNFMTKNSPLSSIDMKYYLKSPELLKDFQKEAYNLGVPKSYDIKTDEASYNRIVGPVEGLAGTTTAFLITVLIFGSAILILLSILAIRERKYEIGVLRAMGMNKLKVAMGLVTEMVVITLGCLIMGLAVGSFAAQPIANGMLQNQIQISQENEKKALSANNGIAMAIDGNNEENSALSEINVGIDGQTAGEISLIALALALVSSAAGIAFITKYEPMRILSERN